MSYQILFCTCPDHHTAEQIAYLLLESNLAACVSILPNVTSIYRWKQQVERADEVLLLIKAQRAAYVEIESTIKAHHPYEIPEIIALRIERGLPDYLQWIDSCHIPN